MFGRFRNFLIFSTPEYQYSYSKVNFASTRNSGSPSLDLLSHFLFFPEFRISKVRQDSRTLGRNLERSAGISNVRVEFRTFGWNFERSAGISHFRLEFRTFGRNNTVKILWRFLLLCPLVEYSIHVLG